MGIENNILNNFFYFIGKKYDAENGLYYYRARHYNPTFGRFLQRDPIGIWEDEVNLGNGYTYVGNNGGNWVDPMGLYVFYGNYCGRGDKGGAAINKIDGCCKKHDECWEDNPDASWTNDVGNCNKTLGVCISFWVTVYTAYTIYYFYDYFTIAPEHNTQLSDNKLSTEKNLCR